SCQPGPVPVGAVLGSGLHWGETPAPDCSLRITGVTPQDSGGYTLICQASGRDAEAFGHLWIS
ncbi:hypothetical protein KIL84_004961, partial [Mauremys mutica]